MATCIHLLLLDPRLTTLGLEMSSSVSLDEGNSSKSNSTVELSSSPPSNPKGELWKKDVKSKAPFSSCSSSSFKADLSWR